MTPRPGHLVVLGDVHLGGGEAAARWGRGFRDGFVDDDALAAFLTHLRTRRDVPERLLLVGDTVDFLRVAVPGERPRLYARDDAGAVRQLDLIHDAHPGVFAALAGLLAGGTRVEVVIGNHDVELARPAVQDRLRALLAGHRAGPWRPGALAFHPWAYHLPGVLYAEHGHHYHDINSLHRPILPFDRRGRAERPPAARLGGVRRLATSPAPALWLRDALRDAFVPGGIPRAARRAYRAQTLPGYARQVGLDVHVVSRLHAMGRRSVLAGARRMVRARLAGGPAYADLLPGIAGTIDAVLRSRGQQVPFYVFGHTHRPEYTALPGSTSWYLNAGTWSTDVRPSAATPVAESPRHTWIEIDRNGDRTRPTAVLRRWADGPVDLPAPAAAPAPTTVDRAT